jgi:hypothetical protein
VCFRWNRDRWASDHAPVSGPVDDRSLQTAGGQAQGLHEWRCSAQRVARTWNAWLAADRRDRGTHYRAYVSALAAEERAAAEVQRMLQTAEPSTCGTNPAPGDAGSELRHGRADHWRCRLISIG